MYFVSLLLALPLAWVFQGAGRNKLTKSMDDLAAAGLGWVKEVPSFVVRLIGLLELAGVVGILAGPLAKTLLTWTWANTLGLYAAAGLALTMLVAAIMHIVRKEFKYTWKMNVGLFVLAAAEAVVIAFV
ncbi:MAG: DoxX family protein [Microbacteriaceae bacterium]